MPTPSKALSVSTAASARSAARRSTNVFSVITVAPKPKPSAPVAQHSSANAAEAPIRSALAASSAIERRSAPRPNSSTPRMPSRRASQGPTAEAKMASATCGMNIAPYCALDKWKPVGLDEYCAGGGKRHQRQALHHAAKVEQAKRELALAAGDVAGAPLNRAAAAR